MWSARQRRRVGADDDRRGAWNHLSTRRNADRRRCDGERPGNGLFGEVVALDLKTGKRLWHYQLIHHGIWDWDIPCAPILTDITTVNGAKIKAVAQPRNKAGSMYSIASPVSRSGRSGTTSPSILHLVRKPARRSPSQPGRRRSIARAHQKPISSISPRRSRRGVEDRCTVQDGADPSPPVVSL